MVIQRSWKIINDNSSNSASSTEAVRSPIILGLSSSSDDSNLSNHTSHSMITRAATPTSTSISTTANAASNPQALTSLSSTTPTNTVSNPQSMVFALQNGGTVGAAGSSSSSATAGSDPIFVTTPHMAESMLQRLRQRLNYPLAAGSNATDGYRSMELCRISVQSAFDKEIDVIIKRFMEDYFRPAFNNIKENLGRNAISEDMLLKMSCALLENSKAQYNAFRTKSTGLSSDHANCSQTQHRVGLKRPAPQKVTTPPDEITKKFLTQSSLAQQEQQQVHPPIFPDALPSADIIASPQQQQQQQQLQIDQQLQQSSIICTPATATTPARRQIFWNTALISTSTKFVLDVQANPAFGYGTDGQRLASKHPDLIRYLPDTEDRDWLVAQNIIAAHNKNARFLFLIHDELCRLKQSHEAYRLNDNIDLKGLHTFSVPEFMIQKMKLFFVDLHMKSRGLITNSFSMSTMRSSSAAGAATTASLSGLLVTSNNGIHPSNFNSGSSSNNNIVANNNANSSQLRNALLLGTTPTNNALSNNSNISLADSSSNCTVNAAASASAVSTTSDNPEAPLPSSSSSASATLRSRLSGTSSSLSSSHATLTALLNNSLRNRSSNLAPAEIPTFSPSIAASPTTTTTTTAVTFRNRK